MPGKLRCGTVDFKKRDTLVKWLNALVSVAANPINTRTLIVDRKYYFRISGAAVTTGPGWYLVHDDNKQPLYVGRGNNLNSRLNTDNGTRDCFANPQRTSDSMRNFIKTFAAIDGFGTLKVVLLPEGDVMTALGMKCGLDPLDKNNVEKLLNIFRCHVATGRLPRFKSAK
jgi:hypothetical protein